MIATEEKKRNFLLNFNMEFFMSIIRAQMNGFGAIQAFIDGRKKQETCDFIICDLNTKCKDFRIRL